MKLKLLIIGIVTTLLSLGTSVVAQTNTKTIQLGFNQGTTLSWNNSSEIIQKIWLDNPSFATIDILGCIKGWNGCNESNSQMIHLKRIADLKLKGIPQSNETLLTVVTQDQETKEMRVHTYTLRKSSRTNSNHIAAVTPKPKPTVTRRNLETPPQKFGLSPEDLAQRVDVAIANAQQQQPLPRKTKANLIRFSSLLKLGTAEHNALRMSGVSEELIHQILKRQRT